MANVKPSPVNRRTDSKEENRKLVVEENRVIHELFIEAGQIHRLFTGTTPIDLFRYFETNGPLSDKMLMYPYLVPTAIPGMQQLRSPDVDRREVPEGSGNYFIFPNRRMALSLFDGPAQFAKPGIHHVLPQGTTIPPGLAVSRDNLSKKGYTHYSVHAVQIMAELHYLFLLRRLAANAIPINEWSLRYPERAKLFKS